MRTRRLPLHPQPLPDEALSSWLTRLGRAYGLDLERFLAQMLGVPGLPRRMLDRDPPPHLVESLSERTRIRPERIRRMTLVGYTPLLIDTLRPGRGLFATYVGQFETLAPAAPRLATTILGLDEATWLPWIAADLLDDERPRCCRRCLVEDAIPHVRLPWRMAWMASCPLHGERLEAVHVGQDDPGWAYAWKPTRVAPSELTFIDRLTWTAVTTGTVQLPCGRELHAGAWVRLLRSLVDEMTRPVLVLGHGAHAQVLRAWRDLGFAQRKVHGAHPPFETLPPERRDAVLAVAGLVAKRLTAGSIPSSVRPRGFHRALPLLRPPPARVGPDLASSLPPPPQLGDDPVAEAIAAARADPRKAYRMRRFLIRRERLDAIPQLDACLIELGFPIVTVDPRSPAEDHGASAKA